MYPDRDLRADPDLTQIVGKLAGPPVQFPVGQPLPLVAHGHSTGIPLHLVFDDVMYTIACWFGAPSSLVPVDDDVAFFVRI